MLFALRWLAPGTPVISNIFIDAYLRGEPLRDENGDILYCYKAFYVMKDENGKGRLYPPMVTSLSDEEQRRIKGKAASGTLRSLSTGEKNAVLSYIDSMTSNSQQYNYIVSCYYS